MPISSYFWSLRWLCDVSTWVGWITFPRISFLVHFRVTRKMIRRSGGGKWSHRHCVAHTCCYWSADSTSGHEAATGPAIVLSFAGSFFTFSDSWDKDVCLALWQIALAGCCWNQGQKQGYEFQFTIMDFHIIAVGTSLLVIFPDSLPYRLEAPTSEADTTALWRPFSQLPHLHKPSPCSTFAGFGFLVEPWLTLSLFDHEDTNKVISRSVDPPHLWRKTKEPSRDYRSGFRISETVSGDDDRKIIHI